MVADAMDDARRRCLLEMSEKQSWIASDDAVVERIALGRPVEAHGQYRALLLDFEQRCMIGSRGGGGVSHGLYWFLCRIVIVYNH